MGQVLLVKPTRWQISCKEFLCQRAPQLTFAVRAPPPPSFQKINISLWWSVKNVCCWCHCPVPDNYTFEPNQDTHGVPHREVLPRCQVHTSLMPGKHVRQHVNDITRRVFHDRKICSWKQRVFSRDRTLIQFESRCLLQWPRAREEGKRWQLIIKRTGSEHYCQRQRNVWAPTSGRC